MQDLDNEHAQTNREATNRTERSAERRHPPGETSFSHELQEQWDRGALDHPLIPARRVNGSTVYNQAGEAIGKIEDLAIDKRSGKVAYAILSFGGFIGLGEKHQPLPWSALNYDPERGGYVVDVTEEFLRLAPKLETSALSGWDDSGKRDAFYAYYASMGVRPYW